MDYDAEVEHAYAERAAQDMWERMLDDDYMRGVLGEDHPSGGLPDLTGPDGVW